MGKANDELCSENENFIQTKFGYCFYSLENPPFIYNLYIHPKYRGQGHSKWLLNLIIHEIREKGYTEEIHIQAEPKDNSISLTDLKKYYERMGLVVDE